MSLQLLNQKWEWDLRLNWRHFAFFLGVPVAISLYESVGDRYWIQALGIPLSILFHMGHAVIPWWVSAICTQGAKSMLRHWRPNLLIVALSGAFLANIVAAPYVHWLSAQFDPTGTTGQYFTLDTARESAQAMVLWVVMVVVFDRFLGFRIFRYDGPKHVAVYTAPAPIAATPDAPIPAVAQPNFLQRVSPVIRAEDVTALKAEEHYVRVFTADSEELILCRFSDAVAEMDDSLGVQVHRSYWVALNQIERIESTDRKVTLQLKSGLSIPVSARYQEIVRQRTKDFRLESQRVE